MNETVMMARMCGGREGEGGVLLDRNCVVEKADSRVAGRTRASGGRRGGLLRRRYLRNCVVLSLSLPSLGRPARPASQESSVVRYTDSESVG